MTMKLTSPFIPLPEADAKREAALGLLDTMVEQGQLKDSYHLVTLAEHAIEAVERVYDAFPEPTSPAAQPTAAESDGEVLA